MASALEQKIIFQAIDAVTGPLAKMGAQVRGFGTNFVGQTAMLGRSADAFHAKLRGVANTMTGLGGGMAGMFGMALGGMELRAVAEYDKDLHSIFTVTGATADVMERFRAEAVRVSGATGSALRDLLEMGPTAAGLNMGLDAVVPKMAKLAEAARILKMPASDFLKMEKQTSIQFGLDWNNEKVQSQLIDTLVVAAKRFPGGGMALEEAMKAWGPVASKLHMSIAESVASAASVVASGFEPGQAGTALASSMMRLAALTPQASAALKASNVDIYKILGVDKTKLLTDDKLIANLGGLGLGQSTAR